MSDDTNTQTPVEEQPGADTTTEQQPGGDQQPDKSSEERALEAFDRGLATVGDKPPADKDEGDAAAEGKDKTDAGDKKDGAAAAAGADAAKPGADKKDGKDAGKDEDKAAAEAVEKEITDLKLQGKTADRFRELSNQVRDLSRRPTDDDLAPLRAAAERASQWEGIIKESTAKPEQLQSLLGYAQAINSGDPGAMNSAFDALAKELAWLGGQIGREVPGMVDPLAEHPDLAKEVEDGELSRKRALEIAKQRAGTARATETAGRREEEQAREREFREAAERAVSEITALGDRLKASDPAFAQKVEALKPTIEIIKSHVHPSQWAAQIETAYRKLPAMAPAAAAPPAPSHQPIRPTGSSAGQTRKPKNAEEAFELGVQSER